MSLPDILFLLLIPFAVLAWRRWDWALLTILALLPSYLWRLTVGGIPTTWLEAAIYILLIVVLLRSQWWNFIKSNWLTNRSWIVLGLGWALVAIAGVVVAPDKRLALGILKGWIMDPLVVAVLFYYATAAAVSKIEWWQKVTAAFWCGGVYTSLSALIMAYSSNATRFNGWYDSPNVLAMYLLPILAMSLLVTRRQEFKNTPSLLLKIGWWGGNAIMAAALFGTNSYTALIALAAGALMYVLFSINYNRILAAGLGFSIVVVGILLPFVMTPANYWFPLTHYNSTYKLDSGQMRLILWREAGQVIQTKPLWGLGLGQWQPYFLNKVMPYKPELRQPGVTLELYYASLFPHNLWLTTWLNLGLLGVIILAILAGKLFRAVTRTKAVELMVVLAIILTQGMVDTPFYKNDWSIMWWVMVAAVAWLNNDARLSASKIG
ncbi:MAG: O-antigen ligase family protein [Patescibacteria group bacterium]